MATVVAENCVRLALGRRKDRRRADREGENCKEDDVDGEVAMEVGVEAAADTEDSVELGDTVAACLDRDGDTPVVMADDAPQHSIASLQLIFLSMLSVPMLWW